MESCNAGYPLIFRRSISEKEETSICPPYYFHTIDKGASTTRRILNHVYLISNGFSDAHTRNIIHACQCTVTVTRQANVAIRAICVIRKMSAGIRQNLAVSSYERPRKFQDFLEEKPARRGISPRIQLKSCPREIQRSVKANSVSYLFLDYLSIDAMAISNRYVN